MNSSYSKKRSNSESESTTSSKKSASVFNESPPSPSPSTASSSSSSSSVSLASTSTRRSKKIEPSEVDVEIRPYNPPKEPFGESLRIRDDPLLGIEARSEKSITIQPYQGNDDNEDEEDEKKNSRTSKNTITQNSNESELEVEICPYNSPPQEQFPNSLKTKIDHNLGIGSTTENSVIIQSYKGNDKNSISAKQNKNKIYDQEIISQFVNKDIPFSISRYELEVENTNKRINEQILFSIENNYAVPILFKPSVFNFQPLNSESVKFLRENIRNGSPVSAYHFALYYANELEGELYETANSHPSNASIIYGMRVLGYPRYPPKKQLFNLKRFKRKYTNDLYPLIPKKHAKNITYLTEENANQNINKNDNKTRDIEISSQLSTSSSSSSSSSDSEEEILSQRQSSAKSKRKVPQQKTIHRNSIFKVACDDEDCSNTLQNDEIKEQDNVQKESLLIVVDPKLFSKIPYNQSLFNLIDKTKEHILIVQKTLKDNISEIYHEQLKTNQNQVKTSKKVDKFRKQTALYRQALGEVNIFVKNSNDLFLILRRVFITMEEINHIIEKEFHGNILNFDMVQTDVLENINGKKNKLERQLKLYNTQAHILNDKLKIFYNNGELYFGEKPLRYRFIENYFGKELEEENRGEVLQTIHQNF